MPRVSPAVKTNEISTEDLEVKQPKPREMKGTGPAKVALEPASIEPADRPIDKEWAANMAFAKEKIVVRVHESTDENAEKIVEVWNQGDYQRFVRGEDTTCERRFVETLMRAKPTKYSQKAVLDDLGKVGGYREVPHTALRYPFSVVRDDNPLGAAWLKAVLSEL